MLNCVRIMANLRQDFDFVELISQSPLLDYDS